MFLKEKQSSDPTKFEAKVHIAWHEDPVDTYQVAIALKANNEDVVVVITLLFR